MTLKLSQELKQQADTKCAILESLITDIVK